MKSLLETFNTEVAARKYAMSTDNGSAGPVEIGGWLVGGSMQEPDLNILIFVVCGIVICPQ